MCNKTDNSCRQEKLGCKGCFYNICNDEEKKAIKRIEKHLIEMLNKYEVYNDCLDVQSHYRNGDIKILLNLIENQQKELNNLKEIEQQHRVNNGLLRQELDMQIEHNKELEAITKTYNAYNTEKDDDKIILADKRYFDCGVFSDNLIAKSKIIDLKRYYEEQAEETKMAYGKLRNISNLYRIYR